MTRHDWLATATLALALSGCADQKEQANQVMTSQPEQQQIAYQVASKSIVLLKNDLRSNTAMDGPQSQNGTLLPLDLTQVKTIAVIGDNATKTMAQGGVGAGVKTLYEITPLAGIQQALDVLYAVMIYFTDYYSSISSKC